MTREGGVQARARYVELEPDECWKLLAGQQVGRLGVVVGVRPQIFPVNYVVDGQFIMFRTDPGTKLSNACLDRVAFEIDQIDSERREGWSVLVQGIGVESTDGIDLTSERESLLQLDPWAPGQKAHWVTIIHPEISGRRIDHGGHARERGH